MNYRKEQQADAKVRELQAKGYKVKMTTEHLKGRTPMTLYNVWVTKKPAGGKE